MRSRFFPFFPHRLLRAAVLLAFLAAFAPLPAPAAAPGGGTVPPCHQQQADGRQAGGQQVEGQPGTAQPGAAHSGHGQVEPDDAPGLKIGGPLCTACMMMCCVGQVAVDFAAVLPEMAGAAPLAQASAGLRAHDNAPPTAPPRITG